MEVILDSSFIISCVRSGIDFIDQLEGLGFKPVIPKEVLQEMKDISARDGASHADKEFIEVAFKIIELKKVKKMSLGDAKVHRGSSCTLDTQKSQSKSQRLFGHNKVDDGLVKLGKEGIYIATLDKAIRREVKNRVIISSAGKKVMVERQ